MACDLKTTWTTFFPSKRKYHKYILYSEFSWMFMSSSTFLLTYWCWWAELGQSAEDVVSRLWCYRGQFAGRRGQFATFDVSENQVQESNLSTKRNGSMRPGTPAAWLLIFLFSVNPPHLSANMQGFIGKVQSKSASRAVSCGVISKGNWIEITANHTIQNLRVFFLVDQSSKLYFLLLDRHLDSGWYQTQCQFPRHLGQNSLLRGINWYI